VCQCVLASGSGYAAFALLLDPIITSRRPTERAGSNGTARPPPIAFPSPTSSRPLSLTQPLTTTTTTTTTQSPCTPPSPCRTSETSCAASCPCGTRTVISLPESPPLTPQSLIVTRPENLDEYDDHEDVDEETTGHLHREIEKAEAANEPYGKQGTFLNKLIVCPFSAPFFGEAQAHSRFPSGPRQQQDRIPAQARGRALPERRPVQRERQADHFLHLVREEGDSLSGGLKEDVRRIAAVWHWKAIRGSSLIESIQRGVVESYDTCRYERQSTCRHSGLFMDLIRKTSGSRDFR